MTTPKKLIEVAMPIKEISAESVRDKSIRQGHISTLHLWWARRPLPVCRAVVFASLVPDPNDPNCPQAFKDAVELLLGKNINSRDPYATYSDIPWTSAFDPMEDNLRNRLQMFIGKFTQPMQDYLLGKAAKPAAGKMLTDDSLIKWDSKNDEKIINKARKLIWVSHNCHPERSRGIQSAQELLEEFDSHYRAIKDAEEELYSLTDRHIETEKSNQLTENLKNAIESFLNKMPKVFDPFAGGGAIPLEAARLGCRSYGNDINPVAHIIQKGSLEFPQKYGKPISYTTDEFIKLYGQDEFNQVANENKKYEKGNVIGVIISNRLSFDVKFYAKKILSEAEKEIKDLYTPNNDGIRPLVYFWARVANCSNPSCKAEIPLLKHFYLSKKRTAGEKDFIYLNPIISGNEINFEIKKGKCEIEGWNNRTNITCPVCGNITDSKVLKSEFINKRAGVRLLAVVENNIYGNRQFRLPNKDEIGNLLEDIEIPQDSMQIGNNRNFNTPGWAISKFGEMFTKRQLKMLYSLVDNLHSLKNELGSIHGKHYSDGVLTYLGIFIDRVAARNTSLGVWHILQETVEHPFGRQAIPMVFDFPEMYPFSNLSGSCLGQLSSVISFINEESYSPFISNCLNASSGDKNQFNEKSLTAVVTDPPYYDAIAYADLSDFFYLWLKRTLGDVYPMNFATPQTPKAEECTALKHHHSNKTELAKLHFEIKLKEIFSAIEHQTSDIVSIMFAHQSTEAWTTLCNSILGANMNITGSWANDTEVTGALKSEMAVLSSSVTVSCVPTQTSEYGDYREVKKAIEATVAREVDELYRLGFRGTDLLTACFGQAVSEFGKYKKVEKADGSEVTVAELLTMARESAFNAMLKGFDGDEYTKFYIGWLQLNGFAESDFDDAATFAKAGLSINVAQLFKEHILIQNKNKQALATFTERIKLKPNLGAKSDSFLIDQVHKAMALFKGTNRVALLDYINDKASAPDGSFWRVLTSLDELLPKDCEDQKMTKGLLTNKESLIRESKEIQKTIVQQGTLELE